MSRSSAAVAGGVGAGGAAQLIVSEVRVELTLCGQPGARGRSPNATYVVKEAAEAPTRFLEVVRSL